MSESVEAGSGRLTPLRIALVYLLVGGGWILLSDRLVAGLPVDATVATQLQTVKGWVFVGASALLIYVLVARSRRQLRETNRHLTTALQQASVLHRLLRHNLRNACNVIELEARTLTDGGEEKSDERAARAIERQVETLVALGEKSRHLREIALGEQERTAVDVVDVIEREVADFRERHPDADLTVDAPPTARALAYPELEVVVRELLENAMEHSGDAANGPDGGDGPPSIGLTIGAGGGTVTVEIADDGPGMPDMEREVLERGMEEPLSHSQGLGLWVVRAIVDESGGDLSLAEDESTGTVVRIELQAADEPSGGLA